jgi:hypothetical protein
VKRNFQDWMEAVDTCIEDRIGLISLDLPDCDYWTQWDNGTSPTAMANRAIREAKTF